MNLFIICVTFLFACTPNHSLCRLRLFLCSYHCLTQFTNSVNTNTFIAKKTVQPIVLSTCITWTKADCRFSTIITNHQRIKRHRQHETFETASADNTRLVTTLLSSTIHVLISRLSINHLTHMPSTSLSCDHTKINFARKSTRTENLQNRAMKRLILTFSQHAHDQTYSTIHKMKHPTILFQPIYFHNIHWR